MAVETIPIKYIIPKIIYKVNPSGTQSMSLYIRKVAKVGDNAQDTQFQWMLKSSNFQVDKFGIPITDLDITGLEEDMDYEFKLVHNSTLQEIIKPFTTCKNLSLGDSPIYMKKLYREQMLSWFMEGLTDNVVPANTGGFFFDLTGKFADSYNGFGPMDSPLGKNWTQKVDTFTTVNMTEAYNCFHISPDDSNVGKYLTFNMTHENIDARLPFSNIFTNPDRTLMMKFYLDETINNVKILESSVFSIVVNTNRTLSVVGPNFTTITSSGTLEAGRWFTLVVISGSGSVNTNISQVSVYRENATNDTELYIDILSPFELGTTDLSTVPLNIGAPDGTTEGLSVCKIYLSTKSLIPLYTDFKKVAQAYKYIPSLKFASTSGGSESDLVFNAESSFKLGDYMQSDYSISAGKNPLEISVQYNYSGSANLKLQLNTYLWQYTEDIGVKSPTVITKSQQLIADTGKAIIFNVHNDFAYVARIDLSVVLITGTTTEISNLDITSIKNGTFELITSSIVTSTTDRSTPLVSDTVGGDLAAQVTAGFTGETLNVSLAKLSNSEATTTVHINPDKYMTKLDGSGLMALIDPLLPYGSYTMYCQSFNDATKIGITNIEVVDTASEIETQAFDIDFTTDFDAALALFKQKFSANHTQWGGYNGGCNGHLIYASRQEKTLRFENHGDHYNKTVVGVAKPAKDSSFTGYGIPAVRKASNDPLVGQPFKTRVGSIAVSNGYFTHGDISITMRIPKGTYGIAPALWYFHYIEVYPNQYLWQYWLDRGGKPYGGGDPYMVINNEIDMELPSHDVNGTFANWTELENAYFDPLALDTQYRIGVLDEGGTDPSRVGTFQLVDIAHPNLFASWVKISENIQERNYPTFDACKLNNWVGEKSSGNGWAYSQAEYQGEEYLSLLTKLSQNYADSRYHKWTLRWYKDKVELLIDDVLVRTNKGFIPFNIMKYTLGAWFPSQKEEKYTPEAPGSWGGLNANWKIMHMDVNRIQYTPYTDAEGDAPENHSESYPEAGIRSFI